MEFFKRLREFIKKIDPVLLITAVILMITVGIYILITNKTQINKDIVYANFYLVKSPKSGKCYEIIAHTPVRNTIPINSGFIEVPCDIEDQVKGE